MRLFIEDANTFYCAECTYTKSGRTMSIYTTDITEVKRSTMPKDSLKVEGSFLVRRKYFKTEHEAQDYIDSLDNVMTLGRNESFETRGLNLKKTSAGHYKTADGKYEIEKSDGFWYAVDAKTGQSVVDCENSFSQIKDSLESYIKSQSKKESYIKESNAKMKEVKVLQGYYAGHWDDLEEVDADDTQGVKELRDDLKSYDENERYPHRIITRKVPNPNYDPTKARKSRDHGVMVTVGYGYDGSDKEVYFTEDESIADKIDGMILKSYFSSRDELRQDGYDFIRKNMTKLEKGDYEFKKRYSYYTYFLPDGSKPKTIFSTYIDKRFVKESKPYISIKEGDASKKTNYAVMVYDMNTAHYSLFTGTKDRCEQLLSDLEAFESFANDCEDEGEYFAEEEYIMDLLSKYNCIPEIYQRLIDDNSNYSLGLHYGSNSGNMVHIINEDNPISLYL